jgi:hypothetical protein
LVNLLVMEPGSVVMEAKMLNGIKERADGSARRRRSRPEGDSVIRRARGACARR